MSETLERKRKPKTNRHAGRVPRGKANNQSTSPSTKAIKIEPEAGGAMLRDAINQLVGRQSSRIAKALVDKTIDGNMEGARIVIELSGARKPRTEPVKKPRGVSWAKRWAAEPQWKGTSNPDEDVPFLGTSKP